MFCKHCGNRLPDGANFCSECGRVTDEANNNTNQTNNQNYGYETVDPFSNNDQRDEEEKNSLANGILTQGILSLAFMSTFCLSFLGIIFGAIGKAKANAYRARYGETEGKATVGKHLSTAGLISSIVVTAIFVLYFILIVALTASGEFYY